MKMSALKALLLSIGDRIKAVCKKKKKWNSYYGTWVLLEWKAAFLGFRLLDWVFPKKKKKNNLFFFSPFYSGALSTWQKY